MDTLEAGQITTGGGYLVDDGPDPPEVTYLDGQLVADLETDDALSLRVISGVNAKVAGLNVPLLDALLSQDPYDLLHGRRCVVAGCLDGVPRSFYTQVDGGQVGCSAGTALPANGDTVDLPVVGDDSGCRIKTAAVGAGATVPAGLCAGGRRRGGAGLTVGRSGVPGGRWRLGSAGHQKYQGQSHAKQCKNPFVSSLDGV